MFIWFLPIRIRLQHFSFQMIKLWLIGWINSLTMVLIWSDVINTVYVLCNYELNSRLMCSVYFCVDRNGYCHFKRTTFSAGNVSVNALTACGRLFKSVQHLFNNSRNNFFLFLLKLWSGPILADSSIEKNNFLYRYSIESGTVNLHSLVQHLLGFVICLVRQFLLLGRVS